MGAEAAGRAATDVGERQSKKARYMRRRTDKVAAISADGALPACKPAAAIPFAVGGGSANPAMQYLWEYRVPFGTLERHPDGAFNASLNFSDGYLGGHARPANLRLAFASISQSIVMYRAQFAMSVLRTPNAFPAYFDLDLLNKTPWTKDHLVAFCQELATVVFELYDSGSSGLSMLHVIVCTR